MKFKRLISIILVLTLVLSSFSLAMAAESKQLKKLSDDGNNKKITNSSLVTNPRTKGLKDSDTVRIIVELSDKPVIEYATEKNKRFTKLDSETVKTVTAELVNSQISVKSTINEKKIKVDYHSSFVNVINGFSGTTTYGEAKEIEKLPGVIRVVLANEYSRPVPEMNNSLDLVNARATWSELGYNGEGMVVAIVDTGIDPSHKDMVLTNPESAQLSEGNVDAIIAQEGLGGKYFTAKVPYGYNYLDNNQEILDLGPDASRHGMHVAGTVGANGNEEEGGIKGVAPEVQLLAMKVFGNNPIMPSTYSDIIIKAIDDSVKLGADVINMSLGATAAFVMTDDPEQQAVTRAVENGVFMSISAGNSDKLGSGWADPYASNPDIGVVGSPGLTAESMQVAAASNKLFLYESKVTVGDLEIIGYGKDDWEERKVSGDLELVAIGGTKLGGLEDYDGIDVTDKVVLVSRGEHSFYDKTEWAAKNGAIGIIVYDHENEGSTFYLDQGGWSIPFMKIHKAEGLALEELLKDGPITINVSVQLEYLDPATGSLTYFSSWGTTPNLNFKPDITAPGGSIYSTDQNNGYQYMSGTSMAAPHVAGGAALVLQEVNNKFPGLSGREKVEMAKNLIMSTANIVEERFEFTSPRRQGAGGMDLVKAITAPAIITDGTNGNNTLGLSKVELKEIDDLTTFTLTVENFSDETIQYAVYGSISTDLVVGGDIWGEPQPVVSADSDTPLLTFELEGGTVIDNVYSVVYAEANETTSFNVTIDLSEARTWHLSDKLEDVFPNGNFIEGFIQLKDMNDDNDDVDLSIPYVGFYGEWDKAPIIDDNIYDEDGNSFYGYTSLVWNHGLLNLDDFDKEKLNQFMSSYALGITSEGPDKSKIAFSPNDDGYADTAIPLLSFLRNAKELDINILDANGGKIRDLSIQEYIGKNFYDYGGPVVTVDDIWEWDGTVNNQLASDGEYFFEINTKIDYPDAEWQTVEIPVKIDTVAPIMPKEPVYYANNDSIVATGDDGDNGISHYELIEEEEALASSDDGTFDISDIAGRREVFVRVFDYAMNFTDSIKLIIGNGSKPVDPVDPEDPVKEEPTGPAEGDETIPTVMIDETLEYGATFNTSSIEVRGYINDDSSIEEFKVDGEDVDFTFNTTTGNWDFETELSFPEDGVHEFDIDAKDSAGNAINFEHLVVIDTTNPVINVNIPPSTQDNEVTLTGTITDNLYDLKVLIDGNMIANIDGDYDNYNSFDSIEYEVSYDVSLNYGYNTFTITAEDTAGNVTTKEITILRLGNLSEPTGPAENDTTVPFVMLDQDTVPYGATFNTSEITVKGYLFDKSSIEEFKIDGEEIDFVYNDEIGIWDFENTIEFEEDGVHAFDIYVKDSAGNSIDFEHVVVIDTTKPVIDIEIPESVRDSDTVITGTITDNLYDLKVIINGQMIANVDGSFENDNSYSPAEYKLNYNVALDMGRNRFVVEVIDTAGNKSEKEISTIRKSEKSNSSSTEEKPLVSKDISTKASTIKDKEEKVELAFEKGTFDKKESVEVEVLEEKEMKKLDKESKNTRVSDIYEFKTSAKEFKKSVKVTLKYDKSKLKDINEDLLGVYTFDEKEEKWVYVGGKVDKENNTIATELEHFSKYTVMASTKSFEDTKEHWADHEIKVAAAREIINGMDGENYAPEEKITKAQFTKIMAVLLDLENEEYSGAFTDTVDDWYTGYVEAALKAGVISSNEKKFNPNTPITREEMAMMVAKALTYKDDSKAKAGELTFEDKNEIAEEALEAVSIAVENEIIKGMTETTFAPKENATRAQAAVMIYRLLKALDRI